MTFINFFILLAPLSLLILAIVKVVKNLCHSKNTNNSILKELKQIYSNICKKD